MKIFIAVVVLAVAGTVGWYFYCVNPVMSDFQAAVDGGKAEALAPFLDVPSLKKNVADFVKLRYNQTENSPTNLSADQIQAIVDAFVTPQNVLTIMKGVKLVPGSVIPNVPADAKPTYPLDKHYESPDVYAIDIYLSSVQTPDNRMSVLFQREGWFDWKVAAFRFAWGS